ncbi:MAG: glycosyltransferase [Prevotellaceae bacterium]|jgi:glycosyltransferase involved in cell wall biosynthesis|nr:glycosyltransferase [Prevotellaceae bacterium]
MYKVTLAMPVYNVEKYVEQALLSALNQTFESIEFIIVDDRGSDNSMAIVRRILQSHPRASDVRIIAHEANIGLGAARNTAIDNARGEYIYFMDSDDEVVPDGIATLYKAMQETPVDFVVASYKGITLNGRSNPLFCAPPYPDMLVAGADNAVAKAYYLEKRRISIFTWNKLYSVDFLRKNKIRCIPHQLSEDVFFTFQVILKACSCRWLSAVTYLYYQRKESLTTRWRCCNAPPRRAIETLKEIVEIKRGYLPQYEGSELYAQMVQQGYIRAVMTAIRVYQSADYTRAEKKREIAQLLKYPVGLRKVARLSQKHYHLPRYLISKVPGVDAKIRLSQAMSFLWRTMARLRYFFFCGRRPSPRRLALGKRPSSGAFCRSHTGQ